MALLCTLSPHRAAPVVLENQGFLFSRCKRCQRDLVCSVSGPPSWRAVPDGFRVAWRETDLSVFEHASLAERTRTRVRHAMTTARDAVHLAATIVSWRVVDGARTLRTRVDAAYLASKRLVRLPNLSRTNDTCVVIVNLTMRRDPGHDTVVALQPDPGR